MLEVEAKLPVQVSPGAAANRIDGFRGRVLRVRIAMPPVQGKANKELIAFLSEVLKVPKSDVRILRGHTLRNKVLGIRGVSQAEAVARLSSAVT